MKICTSCGQVAMTLVKMIAMDATREHLPDQDCVWNDEGLE